MSDRGEYHPQIGPAPLREQPARGKVSKTLRLWIYARDGFRCVDCGGPNGQPDARTCLTLDHIVPAVVGGREWASNLVTRCQSCNSRRHAEWIRSNGYAFYPIAKPYVEPPRTVRA